MPVTRMQEASRDLLPVLLVIGAYTLAYIIALIGGRLADEDWKKQEKVELEEKKRKRETS